MARVLGIDVGTGKTSAVLMDVDGMRVIAVSSRAHNADVKGLRPGRHEQDPALMVASVRSVVADLAPEGRLRVDGAAVTGQMHGFVPLDRCFVPVGSFVTWRDRRALEKGPDGRPWLEAAAEAAADVDLRLAPGYAAAGLYAMTRAGTVPSATRWIATVHDWIAAELCGRRLERPVTDPTFAHSTGLCPTGCDGWNAAAAGAIDIDLVMFPEIRPVGARIGEVAEDADVPIVPGAAVVVGLGDNQASFLGAVRDPRDTVLLNVGTGGQMSVMEAEPRRVPEIEARPYLDGSCLLVGAPLCGGKALSLLADLVADILAAAGGVTVDRGRILDAIEGAADIDTDLECSVAFSGTRADPNARGHIRNIGEDDLTFGDLGGCIINGIAAELYALYDACGVQRGTLVGSGNGIRRNPRLRESSERLFGAEMLVPKVAEEAAFGAALAAAVGIGAVPDYQAVSRAVRYGG